VKERRREEERAREGGRKRRREYLYTSAEFTEGKDSLICGWISRLPGI